MAKKEKRKGGGKDGAKDADDGRKTAARNKRARFRYNVSEIVEAGLELRGNEVKSIREGGCSLEEAYARFFGDQLYLIGCQISPYEKGRLEEQDRTRKIRLLLHRRELNKLVGKAVGTGYTIVPLSIYFKRGWAKVEIGLAKGKGGRDRREDIKKRDHDREIGRAMKRRR